MVQEHFVILLQAGIDACDLTASLTHAGRLICFGIRSNIKSLLALVRKDLTNCSALLVLH